MPLTAKNTLGPSMTDLGTQKKLVHQRKGLRDVSNISCEVIKNIREPSCRHGQIIKTFLKGERKTSNETHKTRTLNCPKLYLLPPKDAASKKEIVEDIDKYFEGNYFLVKEYAKHIYQYLLKQEDMYKLDKWPLKNSTINCRMRKSLVDYIIDIQTEYGLLQETIHLGVFILDKYIQTNSTLTRDEIQIVSICALYLASKYEETCAPTAEDFISLHKDHYPKKDFYELEQKMLRALDYRLGRPAAVVFLRRFNMASKADRGQYYYSKYFVDLSLSDSAFCDVRPSLVAASSVYIAMCIVNNRSDPQVWNATMVHYTTYTYSRIKPVKSLLAGSILASLKTRQDTVKRKYGTPTYNSVSIKIYAYLELLRRIKLD